MAGPVQARAARSRPNQNPGISASSQLVRRSVSVNNQKFSTLISDGATAQQVLAKIAKENGGGVAKFYNKKLGAHEIVAIKIGDHLLVKDDPKLVMQSDFSQFDNPGQMKVMALEAAGKSKGGLHFFLGENGIPMAAGKDGELLFPNADELRLSGQSHTIFISVVDYNANPMSLNDLNDMYREQGGLKISDAARQQLEHTRPGKLDEDEIAKSHGGMRFEKLMLPDTSVLILQSDTGELKSAAERGAEGFNRDIVVQEYFSASAPAAPLQATAPVQARVELMPAAWRKKLDLDGAAVKPSNIYVKLFDGKIEDELSVRPSPELPAAESTPRIGVSAPAREVVYQAPAARPGTKTVQKPASLLRPVKQRSNGESRQLTYFIRSKKEPVLFRLTAQKPARARSPRAFPQAPLGKMQEPARLKAPQRLPGPTVRKTTTLKRLPAQKDVPQAEIPKARKGRNEKAIPIPRKAKKPRPTKKSLPPKPGSDTRKRKGKKKKVPPKLARTKKKAVRRKDIRVPISETIDKRARRKNPSSQKPKPASAKKDIHSPGALKPKRKKKSAARPAETVSPRKKRKRRRKKAEAGMNPYYKNEMLGLTSSKKSKKKRPRKRRTRAGN